MWPLAAAPFRAYSSTVARAAGRVAIGSTGKRRLEAGPAITLTDAAKARIQSLLSKKPDALGVRLGVRTRGCNGMSYTLNYAEKQEKFDEVVDSGGPAGTPSIKIFIEPRAMLTVVGTVMDWHEDALSAEFVFTNPNAKSLCGCGESFSV